MKDEDEVNELLRRLPERLEEHFGPNAIVDAGEIQMHHVRGYSRLTRCVMITTAADEEAAKHQIELAFEDLSLFGEQVR
jgi:hypothetical protein